MNPYIIQITVKPGMDRAQANRNLQDAIQSIESWPSTTVEVFYAVPATYDYIAIIHVASSDNAMAAATTLTIGGDAKTSVSLAMTADAYAELLIQYGNKKS